MAFHVEIDSQHTFQSARVFNLEPETLRDDVIAPWLAGRPVALGGELWDPAASDLTVLESPALEPHDLAHGQGWNNARRRGRDVTAAALATVRESLASIGFAVLAAEDQDIAFVRAALERVGAAVLPWEEVRSALLHGTVHGIVVLAIGDAEPSADWWFQAGLAIGALGPRALVVATGEGPLHERLAGHEAARLLDGDEAFAAALDAARAAGAVSPRT